MRLPTLRQLQYFLALVDTPSFGRAAANCHVTQSTLSAGLAELEELLGEKLFHRGTRRIELSQVGKELVPLARTLLEQATHLVRVAQQNRAPLSSTLSLGIIPTIAPYILPHLLPALQTEFPDLDLQIKEDITGHQLTMLAQGMIDVVLMALPYSTEQTEGLILWREPFFLARTGDARTSNTSLTLDDLQNENILLLDDGHCLRDHILSACRLNASNQSRKTLGATSLQTLVQMVQNGYGVTLLPAMAIDADNLPKGIVIQRFANPQPSRQIALVWRKSDPRRKEFELLGGFIKKIGYIERRR